MNLLIMLMSLPKGSLNSPLLILQVEFKYLPNVTWSFSSYKINQILWILQEHKQIVVSASLTYIYSFKFTKDMTKKWNWYETL